MNLEEEETDRRGSVPIVDGREQVQAEQEGSAESGNVGGARKKARKTGGHYCCAVDCHHNVYADGPRGIKFYRFPHPTQDPDRRKQWFLKVNRRNPDGSLWHPVTETRLCSSHFISGEKSNDPESPDFEPSIFPTHHVKPKLKKDSALSRCNVVKCEVTSFKSKRDIHALQHFWKPEMEMEGKEFNNRARMENSKHQTSADKLASSRKDRHLFEKLSSWKAESHRNLSDIIKYHNSSKNKVINDLVQEVRDLKAMLSVTVKEKNDLIEMNNNLSGEVRQLTAKLLSADPLSNHLDTHILDTEDFCSPEEIIPDTEEQAIESEGGVKEEYIDNRDSALPQQINYDEISYDESAGVDSKDIEHVAEDEVTNAIDTHICSQCDFEFSTSDNLRTHYKHVHSNLEMLSNFKRHRESIHKMGDKKYKCVQCPYSFTRPSGLKRHIKSVHEKIMNHVCRDCGYATSRKDKLNQHNLSRHNPQIGKKKGSVSLV